MGPFARMAIVAAVFTLSALEAQAQRFREEYKLMEIESMPLSPRQLEEVRANLAGHVRQALEHADRVITRARDIIASSTPLTANQQGAPQDMEMAIYDLNRLIFAMPYLSGTGQKPAPEDEKAERVTLLLFAARDTVAQTKTELETFIHKWMASR